MNISSFTVYLKELSYLKSMKRSITVNGQMKFLVGEEDLDQIDIRELRKGHFHLICNGKSIDLFIDDVDLNNREYSLRMEHRNYRIRIGHHMELLIDELGMGKVHEEQHAAVLAPMPGLIREVRVKEGQKVSENEVLIILEAMKMENMVLSPVSGIVRKIYGQAGSSVQKSEILIAFE